MLLCLFLRTKPALLLLSQNENSSSCGTLREIRRRFEDWCTAMRKAAIQALDLLIQLIRFPLISLVHSEWKVSVLLKKHADWRWTENRSHSPWYPSMRLFRQQEPGDWTGVIFCYPTELGDRYRKQLEAAWQRPDKTLETART